MARVDLYQQVTDLIVTELEKGVAPWVRPWRSLGGAASGLPHNGYTRRPYRGVNVWVLVLNAAARGFDDPRWFTLRQANLLGARIKKGEKATLVAFWKDLTVEDHDPVNRHPFGEDHPAASRVPGVQRRSVRRHAHGGGAGREGA